MNYIYFSFGFNFTDRNGKKIGRMRRNGVLDGKGISFDGFRLNYEDFFKVMRQHEQVLFVLYPALGFPKELNEYIFKETNSFIIDVAPESVFMLKAYIDQYYSKKECQAHRQQLKSEGKEHYFKAIPCPRCEASVDISLKKSSPYIYCKYCELVFNKYGQSILSADDYKICPECSYFNRVRHFPDAEAYWYRSESAFHFGSKYYCDSCAEADFQVQISKNFPYLIALPHTISKKLKIDSEKHPTLSDVKMAVFYAQRHEIDKAEALFQSLNLHNEWHPAVYYNRGKAYLDFALLMEENAGNLDEEESAKMLRNKGINDLKKSLQGCSNFEPTLELLRDNGEYEIVAED